MCLAVIALDAHPRFAVVIAANRDEYHRRPSQAARWWIDEHGTELLAGRDLEQGGTWLGVTRRGRWGFVTNVREAGHHDPNAPSRGALVPALLCDPRPAFDAITSLVEGARSYNGFNLVGGEGLNAAFGSNRDASIVALGRGIHGVSNARLDTPWPKLSRAKAGVAAWAAAGSEELEALWPVLADRMLARDEDLPNTGIGRERERLLSSPFIVSDGYGTRCSTVLAISRDGEAQFIERSFDAAGAQTGDVAFRFETQRSENALGLTIPQSPLSRADERIE